MLTLYHYDRSTAAQRVRLLLEEKAIAWKSVIVDTARGDVEELPADYHRLNPKGLVPVIIHNGAATPRIPRHSRISRRLVSRPVVPAGFGGSARQDAAVDAQDRRGRARRQPHYRRLSGQPAHLQGQGRRQDRQVLRRDARHRAQDQRPDQHCRRARVAAVARCGGRPFAACSRTWMRLFRPTHGLPATAIRSPTSRSSSTYGGSNPS